MIALTSAYRVLVRVGLEVRSRFGLCGFGNAIAILFRSGLRVRYAEGIKLPCGNAKSERLSLFY